MATSKPYHIYPGKLTDASSAAFDIYSYIHPGYAFVAYANRDSTPYKERYRIPEAETVIRGVRYQHTILPANGKLTRLYYRLWDIKDFQNSSKFSLILASSVMRSKASWKSRLRGKMPLKRFLVLLHQARAISCGQSHLRRNSRTTMRRVDWWLVSNGVSIPAYFDMHPN